MFSSEQLQALLAAHYGNPSPAPALPSPGSYAWYQMQQNDPGMLQQLTQEKNEAVAAAKAQTPVADPAAGPKPEGVSQYLWDRVSSGNLNFNLTSITNNADTRQALIDAGYGDFVKAAFEKAMDDRAAHYMSNGASSGDAWNTAQYDWYNQQYGDYSNDTVSTSSADDLGFGGGSEVDNTDYNAQAAADAQAAAAAQASAAQAAADAQAQAEADAAAAAQAAADKEAYLQSVNEGMQVGIYGNNPGGNPWANPNAGGQGMFGQAYAQAKAAQPQQRQAPMAQQAAPKSTPYADAYIKAKQAAEQPNAVTSMFKNELSI